MNYFENMIFKNMNKKSSSKDCVSTAKIVRTVAETN